MFSTTAFRAPSAAVTLGLAIVGLLQPGSVAAQDRSFRFELTPYLGYRLGGTFDDQDGDGKFELEDSGAWGLMLNGRVRENTQWEVLVGHQGTDVQPGGVLAGDAAFDIDVDYVHLGGTYLFDGDNIRPFIAFTLGVTRFDPVPSSFGSESAFSASVGAGWQLNASKRLGIRLEARAFTTFVDDDSDIFCQSDASGGTCLIVSEAQALTQWEARAGIVFRF